MSLKIKRATRTVPVCLDGDLFAQWETANRQYKEARAELAKTGDTRTNSPEAKRVRELEADAVEISKKAKAETVTFYIQALPRDKWDELATAHVLPDGEVSEHNFPFDEAKMVDAALSTEGAIDRVLDADEKPVKFSHKDWAAFAGEQLAKGQWLDFKVAVIQLNEGDNYVPFFSESRKTPDSDKS